MQWTLVCVSCDKSHSWLWALIFGGGFQARLGDRLQVFSEDFVTNDFVDACIGVTIARFADASRRVETQMTIHVC